MADSSTERMADRVADSVPGDPRNEYKRGFADGVNAAARTIDDHAEGERYGHLLLGTSAKAKPGIAAEGALRRVARYVRKLLEPEETA